MFMASVGSRYFVGEYSATVGELPELLLGTLANVAALAAVGIAAMRPGRVGRVAVAMAAPVCLGTALGRYTIWAEVVRDEIDRSDLGPAFRIQNQAGLVAGLAGMAAVGALGFAIRRRRIPDRRARMAGYFGLVGVACYAVSSLGDWYRYQTSVGSGEQLAGSRLPAALASDPAFVAMLVLMTACALAVGGAGPRALAVGLAAGVVIGSAVIAANDIGFLSGNLVAEGGADPTAVYLWRVAFSGASVVAFFLIRGAPVAAFGLPDERRAPQAGSDRD